VLVRQGRGRGERGHDEQSRPAAMARVGLGMSHDRARLSALARVTAGVLAHRKG
jgi:hypothetical protein